ncbi:uncharacterized protein LOC131235180 [Magnolia sinica]|uniref:uncharacterized protein LOC131235180 n=1 Tax=Magnolia sinica TaxID=86752 RepID=UPI00265AEB94|nr:uncharacterized protein LOC131235180 [Magnolia sinica]
MGGFPVMPFVLLLLLLSGFPASSALLPPGAEKGLWRSSSYRGSSRKMVAGTNIEVSGNSSGFKKYQPVPGEERPRFRRLRGGFRDGPPSPVWNRHRSFNSKAPPPLIA